MSVHEKEKHLGVLSCHLERTKTLKKYSPRNILQLNGSRVAREKEVGGMVSCLHWDRSRATYICSSRRPVYKVAMKLLNCYKFHAAVSNLKHSFSSDASLFVNSGIFT